MTDDHAPPVVAVVVASDPGPWFETCLGALAEQDYPSLSVLVIDDASSQDLATRVAAVLPQAFLRSLDERHGFAAGANEALTAIEGASHLLICHDDVAPAPDAVRRMVEEAFRSNAGLVTPKVVAWGEPGRLVDVGSGMDRFGAPVPRVEPGEIDQSQHDEVREVFVAPGGCTLIRTDLFELLGGFDPEMTLFGEDVDLSWRAMIAGARTVVAPAAIVQHLEAMSSGARPCAQQERMRRRHRIRAVLKNYGFWRAWLLAAQLLLLNAAELVYCLFTGHGERRRDITAAWRWNIGRTHSLRSARADVRRFRRVKDGEIRKLQVPPATSRGRSPAARLASYAGSLAGIRSARPAGADAAGSDGLGAGSLPAVGSLATVEVSSAAASSAPDLPPVPHGPEVTVAATVTPAAAAAAASSGPQVAAAGTTAQSPAAAAAWARHAEVSPGADEDSRRNSRRETVLVLVVAAVAVFIGVRDLVFARLPEVGQLLPWPGPTTLLERYFGGWQNAGLQHTGPAPVAFALFGVVGLILGGSMGLLVKIIVLGAVPFGAWGASRLVAPFGSQRGRLAAAVAYLAIPLGWNDIGRGDLEALVAYAVVPFILVRLSRAVAVAPFESPAGVEGELPPATPAHSPAHRSRRRHAAVSTGRKRQPGLSAWVIAGDIAALGLLVGLTGAVVPVVVVLTAACTLALAIGSAVLGDLRGAGRVLGIGAGGSAVAIVLLFPWSLTFFQTGASWSVVTGPLGDPARIPSLAALSRFDTGSIGGGVLSWGLLAAAGFVLLAGRRSRFGWGTRWWAVVLASIGLAWAMLHGWLGPGGGSTGSFLAPAAAAVAGCIGVGVVAFERDLPRFRFGWRHLAIGGAAVCVAAGVLPALGAAGGGRSGLPAIGYSDLIGAYLDSPSPTSTYRVLWLGDPATLPLTGRQIAPGYSMGVSVDGLPDARRLWPTATPGLAAKVADDVSLAKSGMTVRLGHLLAPYGIRYVVIPTESAPGTVAVVPHPPAPVAQLATGLGLQVDVRQETTVGGALIYENTAWGPASGRALPAGSGRGLGSPWVRGIAVAGELVLFAAAAAVVLERRRRLRRAASYSALEATRWVEDSELFDQDLEAHAGLATGRSGRGGAPAGTTERAERWPLQPPTPRERRVPAPAGRSPVRPEASEPAELQTGATGSRGGVRRDVTVGAFKGSNGAPL